MVLFLKHHKENILLLFPVSIIFNLTMIDYSWVWIFDDIIYGFKICLKCEFLKSEPGNAVY